MNALRPERSRPTNGSSTRSRSNGRMNARATAAFCRMPRLKRVGSSSARSYKSDVTEEVGGVLLPVVAAVQAGDVLEVLPHRQVLVERRRVRELRDRRSGRRGIRRAPCTSIGARSRLEQTSHDAQERRLPGAVVADGPPPDRPGRRPRAGPGQAGRRSPWPTRRRAAPAAAPVSTPAVPAGGGRRVPAHGEPWLASLAHAGFLALPPRACAATRP